MYISYPIPNTTLSHILSGCLKKRCKQYSLNYMQDYFDNDTFNFFYSLGYWFFRKTEFQENRQEDITICFTDNYFLNTFIY